MAQQIEAEDPVPPIRELLGERPVHLAREEETGEKHDRPVADPVLVKHQAVALEVEVSGARGHAGARIYGPFAPSGRWGVQILPGHNWREVLVGAVSGLMRNARMLLEDLEGGA
jgi:hypothetical protein